ncbi:phosphotransferase [Amycolatopsis sp.]|uniref:phosphotransferase n=1 Tax=Amycolatopsis sp. TaxID=37632 RepID=UPI002634C427|nr:phosphotransferase [Amycolatopsis sp.]
MERTDVDASFVRNLVREQHPDLAGLEVRPVPSGWDNQPTLTEGFESSLDAVAEVVDVHRAREVWHQAIAAPSWTGPAVWLHGDLHPANAVIADGTISGIVDFGELCAGDPAIDLAAAWKLLPQGASAEFLSAYGVTDEATVHRAQGWAVLTALGLVSVGQAWERGLPGGQPTWGRAGRRILERVFDFAA